MKTQHKRRIATRPEPETYGSGGEDPRNAGNSPGAPIEASPDAKAVGERDGRGAHRAGLSRERVVIKPMTRLERN